MHCLEYRHSCMLQSDTPHSLCIPQPRAAYVFVPRPQWHALQCAEAVIDADPFPIPLKVLGLIPRAPLDHEHKCP